MQVQLVKRTKALMVVNCRPLDLGRCHFNVGHIAAERHLSDLSDRRRKLTVDQLVKTVCETLNIDGMWHNDIVSVECVTDVCDSHEDLVAAQDKEFQLNLFLQSILFQKSIKTLAHHGGYQASNMILSLKCEELLRWLVLSLLDDALE